MDTKQDLRVSESPQDDSLGNYEDGEKYEVPGAVAAKYRGTAADQSDMMALGKTQVLRRNFKFITMLGFASTVMASWEILLPLFTFVLTDGGTADLFWGFIAVASGMMLVYASIAELASMSPTAGGMMGKLGTQPRSCADADILNRSISLGLRIRSSPDTKGPKLHRRLALRHRMASVPRRRVLHGRIRHPRLDCVERQGLRLALIPWHTADDSRHCVFHRLQHIARDPIAAYRGHCPHPTSGRLLRHNYPSLGAGTSSKTIGGASSV